MPARTTWRGAVEVAGFSVNIALYGRVKSTKGISFKLLDADNKPAKQVYVSAKDFAKVEDTVSVGPTKTKVAVQSRGTLTQGVEVAEGEFKPLSDEQIETLEDAEKSKLLEPDSYVPLDTVPLVLADRAFVVRPDEKVPGAEGNVEIVYNGLRESGMAYTTQAITRSGSRDAILVLYVDAEGEFCGASIPFATQLYDPEIPAYEWPVSAKQGKAFQRFLKASEYELLGAFDHSRYTSEAEAVRAKVQSSVLAGKKPRGAKKAPKARPASDLMAALEDSIKEAKPKKRTRKRTATKA